MILSEIRLPLLNANEPEASLVEVHVADGQIVKKGSRLFTIETTKATSEIEAPSDGYVRILTAKDAILSVGDLLAVITESVDDALDTVSSNENQMPGPGTPTMGALTPVPGIGVRITKPALALAHSLKLDLKILPTDRLVTVDIVRQFAKVDLEFELPVSDRPFLLIYGAGGHAKSVLEMVIQNQIFSVAGIIDDNQQLAGESVFGFPVLGTREFLPGMIRRGVKFAANGVGGIVDISTRIRIFDLLENHGFTFPILAHPRATIESSAKVGEGVQIFANAYIGSDAILHPRCMINTNTVVSHDCVIGSNSHIAPGALLAGHVIVGEKTLIGMGVTTAIGVQIGDGVRVGNGAILLADVPDRAIIQAGKLWTGKA